MTKEEKVQQILHSYFEAYPNYVSFGQNIHNILQSLLTERRIDYHSIDHRIKDAEQFVEKVGRKWYQKPLLDMDDICGVRIICYFYQDVDRIIKIIEEIFEIKEIRGIDQRDDPTKFWYRSAHIVASLPKSWSEIPVFRDYADFKVEIQIRTILMHAWAEIEHRLAYKKQAHIPSHLRRKFSRISAKLEEADEQFEELIQEIWVFQREREESFLSWGNPEYRDIPLDLTTLQACMNVHLPHQHNNTKDTIELFEQITKGKQKTQDISDKLKKREPKKPWDTGKSQAQITQEVLDDT